MSVNVAEIVRRIEKVHKKSRPSLARLAKECLKRHPEPVNSTMLEPLMSPEKKSGRQARCLKQLKRLEAMGILTSKKGPVWVPPGAGACNGFSGRVEKLQYQFKIHPSLVE